MKRTEWQEDEEFSGDRVDYARWHKDWILRGLKRRQKQAIYRDKIISRVLAKQRLEPSRIKRIDAIRSGGSINRKEIYSRDKGVCQICGNTVEWADFALDHVIPIALGGRHSRDNVQASHKSCNSKKGTKMNYIAAKP